MKNFLIIGLILIDCHSIQAQKVEWLNGMSGVSYGDDVKVFSACSDSFGNYFVAGEFRGDAVIDGELLTNGEESLFIIKMDKEGNALWVKRETSHDANAFGMATDSLGNLFVAVEMNETFKMDTFNAGDGYSIPRDYVLMKINPSGQILWMKGYDKGDNSIIDDLRIQGEFVYVHGQAEFPTSIQGFPVNGSEQYFLAKYDLNGNAQWVKNFVDYSKFRVDKKGNLIFSATFSSTIQLGNFKLVPQGLYNIFVAKADQEGNYLWVKQTTSNSKFGESFLFDLTLDEFGNVYLTGEYSHRLYFDTIILLKSNHVFFAKCSSNGNWVCVRAPTRDGNSIFGSIIIDKQNDILLGGAFSDTLSFGQFSLIPKNFSDPYNTEFFLLKFNRQGRVLWGLTSDNDSRSLIGIMSLSNDDNIYATGDYGLDMTLQGLHLDATDNLFQCFNFKVTQTIISHTEAAQLKMIELYPNPASNSVYLSGDYSDRIISCEAIDMMGNVFPLNFSKQQHSINIDDLVNGLYALEFILPDEIRTTRLMVEKQNQ